MIEHEKKKYFTNYELLELIRDENTELHKAWKAAFPKFENVILLEQVNRVLYEAKKYKKVEFVEFTKTKSSKKKYFAFEINSVIDYISNYKDRIFNIKVINKE